MTYQDVTIQIGLILAIQDSSGYETLIGIWQLTKSSYHRTLRATSTQLVQLGFSTAFLNVITEVKVKGCHMLVVTVHISVNVPEHTLSPCKTMGTVTKCVAHSGPKFSHCHTDTATSLLYLSCGGFCAWEC